MPKGFETMIGETGRGLSGGQKQRLLIARALYQDPEFLFLDEATNSLDVMNERKIVEALNNAFKQRTVVVIAHRLSTIQHADQIVVLNQGYIAEIGNHQTLMEKKDYTINWWPHKLQLILVYRPQPYRTYCADFKAYFSIQTL